jgi:hypothetical protein
MPQLRIAMSEASTPPASPTFEQAIDLSQSLLLQAELRQIPAAKVAESAGDLLQTHDGARGFFVVYLTQNYTLTSEMTTAIAQAVQANPDTVAELLVKNLVMSSAMVLTHQRQNHPDLAESSQRVRSRTAELISQIQLPAVQTEAQKLTESINTGAGDYAHFLERWGYDLEQRQAMLQALAVVLPKPSA